MSATSQSRPEQNDAFSQMPDFSTPRKKKSHPAQTDVPSEENPAPSTATGKIKSSSGTHIYIGRKITDSAKPASVSKLKETTTLTGFCIDTDYSHKNRPTAQKETSFSESLISTKKNDLKKTTIQEPEAVIIDEEASEVSTQPPPISKGASQNRERGQKHNLSLDISSSTLRTEIPSGSEQIPLGSGVITGILGTGGMARVYSIWNEKLEVFRAVKILLNTNQQSTWTRFETEVKISAKLHHPNIIDIHTVGEWRGIPYLEMEIIEGETLGALINRHEALPAPVCSAAAIQIIRALVYAHSQEILIYGKNYKGIIHRDLKPSNVMIRNDGIVKLMDFGVARPVETGLHTIDTESIVGTIHYFSPEQINGYPIDTLSDIYSFGAVLYEMLCGTNPFPQTSMFSLIRAKEKNSFRRLEDDSRPIDSRLAAVAQVCLRSDKKGRFQSAVQLQSHLEEIHTSFGLGSPEEVLRNFLENPQALHDLSEDETRQATVANDETLDIVASASNARTGQSNNESSCASLREEQDEMETPVKRGHSVTIIIAVLAALLLILGLILFATRTSAYSSQAEDIETSVIRLKVAYSNGRNC
ncbi:MAG: serine/threonine-protein kinase [Chitinispirillaceae bacterium]